MPGRQGVCGVVGAIVVLASAPTAAASTAEVGADGVLSYRTMLGETSRASIACAGSSCTITDPGVVVLPLAGCSGFVTVTCTGVARRDVSTGAGDDDVRLSGDVGGAVALGGGDDAVDSRNGAADDVACGDGADRVSADGIDTADSTCESVDRNVHVDIGDARAGEADGAVRFAVRLTRPSVVPVSVGWATAGGSATAPGDYTAGAGTLTFPPFTTEREVAVEVRDDAADEPDETFTVALSGASGAPIGRGTATGTIADDDPTPGPAAPPEPPAASRDESARTVRADPALDGARAGAQGAGARRRCVVPRVRGLSVRAATRALVRSGCVLARVVVRRDRVRRGRVRRGRALRTDPAAGRSVARGALVVLYVNRG